MIPGLGRSPGERNGYPLQYSGLENSMDCIAHGVTKSQIWLSDFHFSCTFSSNSKSKGNPWHEEILVLLTVYVTLHPTPKQQKSETSLVVQGLRLHAAGGSGSIPGQGTKTPHHVAWANKTNKTIYPKDAISSSKRKLESIASNFNTC